MIRYIVSFFLCFYSTISFALDFNLSSSVKLVLNNPINILHSPNLVTFKYPDFVVSHEIVTYESYYSAVDITGVEFEFFYSVFVPSQRSKLRSDLIPHSLEQAGVFGTLDSDFYHFGNDQSLFGGFNEKRKQGFIFIKSNDHTLNLLIINGDIEHFELLTKSIVRN